MKKKEGMSRRIPDIDLSKTGEGTQTTVDITATVLFLQQQPMRRTGNEKRKQNGRN